MEALMLWCDWAAEHALARNSVVGRYGAGRVHQDKKTMVRRTLLWHTRRGAHIHKL